MSFVRYDLNEYGTMISRHVCDMCGVAYQLCPASPADATCGRPPGTDGPDDRGCASYDESRDVDKMLAAGTPLLAVPARTRGES